MVTILYVTMHANQSTRSTNESDDAGVANRQEENRRDILSVAVIEDLPGNV